MSRIDPYRLLYRVVCASGVPGVFPKDWLEKRRRERVREGYGETDDFLSRRGLVAELYHSPDRQRTFYRVVGKPARPVAVLSRYACLSVEEIHLVTRGGTGTSVVVLRGRSLADLEREIVGFEQALCLPEWLDREAKRKPPRKRFA